MSIWASLVPGTAIKMEASGVKGCWWHMAKAQKFRVFTGREWSSHGSFRYAECPSVGRVLESCCSSEGRICHAFRELSLPCLIRMKSA